MNPNTLASFDPVGDSPLYSMVRRDTHDADEQAACLRDWDQVYEQLSPGQFEGRFMEICFRGIQLFREVTNQSVHEEGMMRASDRVLGVPVAMQGQGYFCGRPITADAIMTMRGGQALAFTAPEHFDVIAVSIPTEELARYAMDIEQRDIEHELRNRPVIHASAEHVNEFRGFLLTALESVSRKRSANPSSNLRVKQTHSRPVSSTTGARPRWIEIKCSAAWSRWRPTEPQGSKPSNGQRPTAWACASSPVGAPTHGAGKRALMA